MAHEFKEISPNASAGAKVTNWFENRFPTAFDAYKVHMSEYYAPKNFNFWYIFGSLALVVLVIQIVTGIFLVMHYKPDANLAFASVEYIMRDVPWGWLIRYMHSTGASAFFSTNSTSAISSMTGSVSGMVMKVVTPPAAAARDADSIVSRCSAPGSPTKTRASTRPGAAIRPRPSTISAPSGAPWFCAPLPMAAIRPFSMTMEPFSSILREGSRMRRFLRTVVRVMR